jgi:hypothetical protein
MPEYGVVLAVIVVGCMVAYTAFQQGVANGTLAQVNIILTGL